MSPLAKKISFLESLSRTLTKAAFVVAFFTLLSSVLGMVRDRLLAAHFGAGAELDVYYAAFRVPDFFYNTVMVGLISSAFLPVLSHYLHLNGKDTLKKKSPDSDQTCPKLALRFPEETQNFIHSLMTVLAFGLFIITGLLWFTTPFLTNWVVPGFSPEQKEITASLTRIMLLSPVFLSFSGLIGNILNLRKFFFFYSLAPVFYNLGSIIAIVFFVPVWGVTALAWGIVLGACLHFLIQFGPAFLMGLQVRFFWNPQHEGVKKVFKMMLPRSIHLGILQLNLIIITFLASTLPIGSLAVFNFANNLQSLPLGIFGASFAIAAFPALSVLVAKKRKTQFRNEFVRIMGQVLFFIIPLSAFLIILRAQVVRIVLGSGKFDWEDTILTLNVLGVLTISLFAQSLNLLFTRAFFALQDMITPLKSGIIGLIVNLFIGSAAVKFWPQISLLSEQSSRFSGLSSPVAGLALAYTASQIATFIFLLVGLQRYLKGIDIRAVKKTLFKIALATFIAGMAAQAAKWLWGIFIPLSSFFSVFGQVAFSGFIGIAFYLFICKNLKCQELKYIYEELPSFLRRKKAQ
ncbi:MAG: murein biosynthesis integral membrane protein MurJ [Candidatus Moranbacteria bacterium]|nr:murein biosynthesis integral membrane protein MurJ [Candidatus Moranbacteria bacterium]